MRTKEARDAAVAVAGAIAVRDTRRYLRRAFVVFLSKVSR